MMYKLQMPYLNMTVFWCYGNFKEKRKLTNLIQQVFHVGFVELINLLGLHIHDNWSCNY